MAQTVVETADQLGATVRIAVNPAPVLRMRAIVNAIIAAERAYQAMLRDWRNHHQ